MNFAEIMYGFFYLYILHYTYRRIYILIKCRMLLLIIKVMNYLNILFMLLILLLSI